MKNGRLNLFSTIRTEKGSNGIISIELNTVKDINSKNTKYNLVISAFTAKDNYVKNLIERNAESIAYKKEELSQVNPQLYKWLATINDNSSTNSISNSSENSNTFEKKSLGDDKNNQNEPKYSLPNDVEKDVLKYYGKTYN